MKFVIILVGICLVQIHGAAHENLEVPWDLENKYPNHPYFQLGFRSGDSNIMLDEANNKLADNLLTKEKDNREKIDQAFSIYFSKGDLLERPALERLQDFTKTVHAELNEWIKTEPEAKNCIEKHDNDTKTLIDVAKENINTCLNKYNKTRDNIKDSLTKYNNSTQESIAQLRALYETCLKQYEEEEDIIRCNFFTSMDIVVAAEKELSSTILLGEAMIPSVVKDHYSCIVDNAYESELLFISLKNKILSCTK